jgi:hypothetical protein
MDIQQEAINPKACLYWDDHVSQDASPLEAAQKLANAWCDTPTEMIDCWGVDYWPNEEFIKQFLDVCKERGHTLDALKIRWMVHNCPGPEEEPCTNDAINAWIVQWMQAECKDKWYWRCSDIEKTLITALRKACNNLIEELRK